MMYKTFLFISRLLVATLFPDDACLVDTDCSLNGRCLIGTCYCDAPWTGAQCAKLGTKPSAVSAKSLYPNGSTWSGPAVWDGDAQHHHMYMPLYEDGSVLKTIDVLHGVSDNVEGPYEWQSMGFNYGANPAALRFTDEKGKQMYSLWIGGVLRVSENPYGPFHVLQQNASYPYPHSNPAPIYHDGAFYAANQYTRKIWSSKSIQGPWAVFSEINVDRAGQGTLEDPTMWIDARGNWHIINHAYNTSQYEQCSESTVSAHLYSRDGKDWYLSNEEPYGHVLQFEDGTNHTYTTLERPYAILNDKRQLTHLVLSADLVTGDEGCPNYKGCPHVPCSCVNCKYTDPAGSVVLTMDV